MIINFKIFEEFIDVDPYDEEIWEDDSDFITGLRNAAGPCYRVENYKATNGKWKKIANRTYRKNYYEGHGAMDYYSDYGIIITDGKKNSSRKSYRYWSKN